MYLYTNKEKVSLDVLKCNLDFYQSYKLFGLELL